MSRVTNDRPGPKQQTNHAVYMTDGFKWIMSLTIDLKSVVSYIIQLYNTEFSLLYRALSSHYLNRKMVECTTCCGINTT